MSNQFGFDRHGFRAFVLCAASRRDILLGKNLSFAPFAFGMAMFVLLTAQVICPMSASHFLAMAPQFVSMYLTFCMLMNLMSIYAPVAIPAGSLKPANPKLSVVLIQLSMIFVLFPMLQLPLMLPFGVEALLAWRNWTTSTPVSLLLAIVECLTVTGIYRWSLKRLGALFQAREQRILEVVTAAWRNRRGNQECQVSTR